MILNPVTLLGLNDRNTEGDYEWTNGVNLNTSTMDHWRNNEPNGHTNENCVGMLKSGGWIDNKCEHSRKFLCEKIGNFLYSVLSIQIQSLVPDFNFIVTTL